MDYGADLLTTLHSRRDCAEMCYVFFKTDTATNHHRASIAVAASRAKFQICGAGTRNFFTLDSQGSYASRISHIIIAHAPRHVDVSLVRTCLLAASRMLHNRVRNRSCPHGTPARDALAQCSQPPPAQNPASSPPPWRLRRRPCCLACLHGYARHGAPRRVAAPHALTQSDGSSTSGEAARLTMPLTQSDEAAPRAREACGNRQRGLTCRARARRVRPAHGSRTSPSGRHRSRRPRS